MIYLANDSDKLQDLFIPRRSLLEGTANPPFDPDNYYTKDETDEKIEEGQREVQEWCEEQGFISGETDPTVPQVVKDITAEDIEGWNNKSDFSGDYNDLENKPSIPVNLTDLYNDAGFIDNTVNNLVNYYTKSETYTQEEVNALVEAIPHFRIQVVDELPATGDSTTVYLVRNMEAGGTDLYDEWIYVNNAWEHLGSARIDLSNYYTKAEVNTLLSGKQATLVSGDNIKTINGASILGSGDITIQAGGDKLSAVEELPASANIGDVRALIEPVYGVIGTWNTLASTSNYKLNLSLPFGDWEIDKDIKLLEWDFDGARPQFYFKEGVEDRIFFGIVYRDETAMTEIEYFYRDDSVDTITWWTDRNHTRNQTTLTVDWTNDLNVIDIRFSRSMSIVPPPNGNNVLAKIGDTSALYKYTNQAKYGRWYGAYLNVALSGTNASAQFVYDYLPASAHHTKLCEYRYTGSYYNNTGFIYWDVNTPKLLIYASTDSAFTPDFSVEPTYTLAPGETKSFNFGIGSGKMTWNGNTIRFHEANYDGVYNPTTGEIAEGWERIVENVPDLAPTSSPAYPFVGWDSKGRVVNVKGEASIANVYLNHSGYSNMVSLLKTGGNLPSHIYVPTESGETGTVLVSQGGTAAPQFKDFYSQFTAGVHFWKGTEEEYDAIETKDPNTFYIIVD